MRCFAPGAVIQLRAPTQPSSERGLLLIDPLLPTTTSGTILCTSIYLCCLLYSVYDDCMMRAELVGHFETCMTDIYIHIDARMADYIRTHPYLPTVLSRGSLVSFGPEEGTRAYEAQGSSSTLTHDCSASYIQVRERRPRSLWV